MFSNPLMPLKETTKHGLNTLCLMINFISVFECKEDQEITEFEKLLSWLCIQLQRDITTEEEFNIAKGILKYIQSEPGTDERFDAMKYLFSAEFLQD